jgi:hypothetical protein
MAKSSSKIDLALRIELARARAAIERENLAQGVETFSHTIKPSSLLRRLAANLASRHGLLLGWQSLRWLQRYPIISSSLSALLLRGGKRFGLLKLSGAAFVAWQLLKMWRTARTAHVSALAQGAAKLRTHPQLTTTSRADPKAHLRGF